jgi:hypothetical protein
MAFPTKEKRRGRSNSRKRESIRKQNLLTLNALDLSEPPAVAARLSADETTELASAWAEMTAADACASAALTESSHDCRFLNSEAYWDAKVSALATAALALDSAAATAACQF